MFEFVNNLNEVDVSNVETIANTVKGGTPFRRYCRFKQRDF